MTALMERTAATPEQWRAAATAIFRAGEAMLAAGQLPQVTLAEWEDDITVKQRAFLHAAVFPQIAEQVNANGDRFTADIWKEYYRKLFLGSKWRMQKLPGQKRAVPVKVRVSTEDLGIKRYSEHIDKVIAHAATEWGVAFVFRADEREAVRYVAPKRKPKPAPAPAERAEAVEC
jgi:hypothetical protein